MNISQKGRELIKKYESFQAKPYLCPAGQLTIGYGHKISNHERFNSPITQKDADRILENDLKVTETTIAKGVTVSLTQGQYDALVSLVYNWGGGNFLRSQGLRHLNNGDYTKAADEFFSFEYGVVTIKGKFSQGLSNRRKEELEMWGNIGVSKSRPNVKPHKTLEQTWIKKVISKLSSLFNITKIKAK
jgi:lysozyme